MGEACNHEWMEPDGLHGSQCLKCGVPLFLTTSTRLAEAEQAMKDGSIHEAVKAILSHLKEQSYER